MPDWAIRIAGLGKRYPLAPRPTTLRDRLAALWPACARGNDAQAGASASGAACFWALRDVYLEVSRGEVLGIVGQNGSGKSTLLKILARITAPSVGFAEVRGRVGALLEVGTGFHLELSGRENIYLCGAVLGMRRAEIRRRFDAIVAFSGVESQLDLPVKRYSSGMYLRLGFAVAAHLDTESLLLDEVLAVGDEAFQQRCLRMVRDLALAGRSVLLVSHRADSLLAVCDRAAVLAHGCLQHVGPAREIIGQHFGTAAVLPTSCPEPQAAPRCVERPHGVDYPSAGPTAQRAA